VADSQSDVQRWQQVASAARLRLPAPPRMLHTVAALEPPESEERATPAGQALRGAHLGCVRLGEKSPQRRLHCPEA